MGDACSLVSDTADAEMAAKDWNRARLTVQALRGQDAPQQVVERFVYTQRSALLKMAKSVLSVVIGIFSAWAMLFGTALISTAAAAALGLAVALVGSASTLYKQAMPNKPVEMLHYIPIRV